MFDKVHIPPIKSQGIKTKIVPHVNALIEQAQIALDGNWIEPFFGTGVVGFNAPFNGEYLAGDTNPHLIRFYQALQEDRINDRIARCYLEEVGAELSRSSDDGTTYYKYIRDRFNRIFDPLDFLFLSRAGFNGMIRFNRKGAWNIPFCKKKDRFAPAYITKICNQIKQIQTIIRTHEWRFECSSFETTIGRAQAGDVIYCDPPYFGRSADFYNTWSEADERRLHELLVETDAHVILSTWHHNRFRTNPMIRELWEGGDFHIYTLDHFYFGGGKISNRHAVTEALICNF